MRLYSHSRSPLRSSGLIGLVVALAATASACGDEGSEAAEPAGSTVADAPESTAPGSSDTTPGSGSAPAIEGESRTVEGAYGPVEIPADPQRIVGDLMAVDYMTALGFPAEDFVGVFGATFYEENHYLAEALSHEGLVDPGFPYEANLEAIAAADPDLIVAPFDQLDGVETLDLMRQIAPVLVVPTSDPDDDAGRFGGSASFQDWRGTLRSFGTVFDREDEAEAYIAETEAEYAALREDFGDLIDATTVTSMKSTPDYIAINALHTAEETGALGNIILSELGFQTPPQQLDATVDEWGSIDLSAENLDLVDADLLFVEVREGSRTYTESPLWDTLGVVAAGNVHEVGNHWQFGGAQGARVVLADLRLALEALAAAA